MPIKLRHFILRRIPAQQRPNPSRQRVIRLRHLDLRKRRLPRRPILHRREVQHQPRFLPIRAAFLLVEPLLRLIPQPLALHHLRNNRRQRHIRPLIANVRRKIPRHIPQHIDPHHVRQPKRSRLRPTHHRARQQIDLLDAQPLRLHDPQRVQHEERPNAVRDKVRHILRRHHGLAQLLIRKLRNRRDGARIRLRRRNHLEQPHVPRRIKEVRPKPPPPQILRQHLRNLRHRQPAGIRRQDRVRTQMPRNLAQQAAA